MALTDKVFENSLKKYVLSEKELKDNGYPLQDPDNDSLAKFYAATSWWKSAPPKVTGENERECERCEKIFRVNTDGSCVRPERCDYHYRRGRMTRGRITHACCQKTKPCASFRSHVFKSVDLTGYVTAPQREEGPDGYGVYCVDCEMIYTTKGMEVAQVTVIDMNLKPAFDSYVRPYGEIVDYNTKFVIYHAIASKMETSQPTTGELRLDQTTC